MQAAFDRHLKANDYPKSIIKDKEFTSSRQVLEGKAKTLRESGMGKKPNVSRRNQGRGGYPMVIW